MSSNHTSLLNSIIAVFPLRILHSTCFVWSYFSSLGAQKSHLLLIIIVSFLVIPIFSDFFFLADNRFPHPWSSQRSSLEAYHVFAYETETFQLSLTYTRRENTYNFNIFFFVSTENVSITKYFNFLKDVFPYALFDLCITRSFSSYYDMLIATLFKKKKKIVSFRSHHIQTSLPVQSSKLNIEHCQYQDGWPLGNNSCWMFGSP